MELEKKLSEEIKEEVKEEEEEEEEESEASNKEENKEEKNTNKKSSKMSSEAKNEENIDNNINKDIKRIDTFSSFGFKGESSNNINMDTNKSESESNINKNKEYINTNTNSSERKIKKKKTLKMKDNNTQIILSQYLLDIILRNKEDLNIIFKRQKYKNILEDIKKTNNYFEIYKPIQEKESRNLNEIMYENRRFINKPMLKLNVSSKEEIELEFYKFGKIIKNPIRKRYGIMTNGNFYSSKEPIAKFNEKKAKSKTKYILNAREIIKEDYDKIKEKNEPWHNEDKKFRIKIIFFNEKNQKNHFLLYFFEEKERDDILELIKLIQLNMTIREPANKSLKEMENVFNKKNRLYMISKILAVKRKLKNKTKIKEYLNDELKKDKIEFDKFTRNIKIKIKNKYIEQKKCLFNKGIQRINKYLIKKEKKNKDEIDSIKNYSYNDIKKACNTIYKFFRKPYNKNINKFKEKNNFVSFKVRLIKNDNNNNFDINDSNLYFNYQDISINFTNDYSKIFLDKDKILDISNVIYNFNLKELKGQMKYNIAILGPYNNIFSENNFSFDINSKNQKFKNVYNKYIDKDNDRFDFLICQIFDIEINKIEIKNFNFVSSITENDYFYIKIIGGLNNSLIIKSRLFNPKIIKDKIIIELNLELFISYEFFENKDKSITIILYYVDHNEISDIDNNMLLLDIINKVEVKKLSLKLDEFMNIPSYETLFDESTKSKIFWNLIVINKNDTSNKNNNEFSKIKIFDKTFKTGNKFYYLENVDDIINQKNIINYFKYEKIDRYVQDLKDEENKILCLCEYIGMINNEEIIILNLLTDEYKIVKYEEDKFILFNNNNFNIINNEIICNFNNTQNENFLKLFKWFKIITFQNEIQMLSFLEILKKLRRLSIYDYFKAKKDNIEEEYKYPYGHLINENLLHDKLKSNEKSKNNFRFILELNLLELKNNFEINKESDVNIEILSISSKNINVDINDINTNKLNLFNILMNNAHKYENSFILNNEKISRLKNNKINNNNSIFNICFTKKINLKNKNGKKINFDKLEKEEKEINFDFDLFNNDVIIINFDFYFKKELKHMYVLIDINKDFFNSILIKQSIKKNALQNENFNFNDIYADYLILPLFLTSNDSYKEILEKIKINNGNSNSQIIISGFLTFKIMCFNSNPKFINQIGINSFEKITNRYIQDYINYCLEKNDKKIKNLGLYEPNIFKNNILSKIIKLYNKDDKKDINIFLDKKGIINETLIPDLNLNNENNSKYLFNKFKKNIYKYKRNIIYNYYIENLWERLLININHNINNDNIYYNFPSKEELLNLYKKNDNLFNKIRNLISFGLPDMNSRVIIWNKLLNINELIKQTGIKLSTYNLYNYLMNSNDFNEQEFNKKKGEIFNILNNIMKMNELEEYLLLIDNIIDLNVINLKGNSNNLPIIKNITLIFYQWTLFNIGETSNANAIKNVSEIKNINEIFGAKSFSKNEYSYYSGVLYLCEKLFNYFKSPSETFWYLVGLSQVIPMFNVNYNLYELTIYNLVIKLILEHHHPKLYKKFVSLNFPLEYFFSKHITYFYSSFFEDIELFIKILDVLIFESTFSKDIIKDPINHLRYLCTIILTVLVENEDKILATENIFQLENLFKILKYKNYNMNNFFDKTNYNIYKYFNNKENDKFGLINNNWENNRIKIEKILDKYYYTYMKNIFSYMNVNFKGMSLILQNNNEENPQSQNDTTNRINVLLWKEKIRKYLYKYSHKEENININKKENRGILMILREIKIFNFSQSDEKEKYSFIGESEINIYPEKYENSKNLKKLIKKIIVNEKGNIIYNEGGNETFGLIDYKYHFKDDSYLIISFCNKEKEFFKFRLNIDSINLLNPIKLELHSIQSCVQSTIAFLELSVMKYFNFLLSDEYSNLYLLFFSPNEYKIDKVINSKFLELKNIPNITELICEEESNLKFDDKIHKDIYKIFHQNIPLIYQFYLDRNFLCSNKKFRLTRDKQILEETKKIIKELFLINGNANYYTEKIINLIDKENKLNNVTIMEILIYIYLDNDIMNLNINDILYNLYNFAMISNKKNICTISNIIELVYILYKKYSIYYEYNQVKSMVNYFFKKEKFSIIKNVLIYKKNYIDKILNNKNQNDIKDKFNKIKWINDYIDITYEFLYIYNNFSEICEMFDLYYKTDLNPQSKNNVILILKIILYNIFIVNKENSNEKIYDYDSFDFIVIEYYKEYTYEELFFSFKYNPNKKIFEIHFLDINKSFGDLNIEYKKNQFKNKNIYEMILLYSNSNFLFNNINNGYLDYNLSFNDFKNVLKNLPYLNDILFKNIYKTFSVENYKLISNRNIKYDKISISIVNNSTKIFEFIFVSDSKNKNYLYNSNFTRIYNSIIINYNIYSNYTIKKIFDIIINKIEYQDLKHLLSEKNIKFNYNEIKDSFYDFKNIAFYTIDENKKYNFLEPLLPLYINFSNNNQKIINFYLDITLSLFLKKNSIVIYKGYSKFPQSKEYEIFQWRKCYILKAENDINYKIKYKSFQNFNKTEKILYMKNIIDNEYNKKNNKAKEINKFNDLIKIEKDLINENLLIETP